MVSVGAESSYENTAPSWIHSIQKLNDAYGNLNRWAQSLCPI